MSKDSTNVKQVVKERYGELARQQQEAQTAAASCCGPTNTTCCGPADAGQAGALYAAVDLVDMPDSVTGISLGCGNPAAITGLNPGETVLDLGAGGGIDCFLAARAVGPAGYVIGVDMTDDMLALANQNKAKMDLSNVEFRRGEIEKLPVESESVDVIISNCVINLSPDKDAVFREAFRVLKPGGRLTVSDIVTEGELPPALQANLEAWAGCVAGALDQSVYLEKLRQAGFTGVAVQSRTGYGAEQLELLDATTQQALLEDVDPATLAAEARVYSANIIAYKPG